MGFIIAFICLLTIIIEPGYPKGNILMIIIAILAILIQIAVWFSAFPGTNYPPADTHNHCKDKPLPPDLYDARYDINHDGAQTTFEKSVQYEDWKNAVEDNDGNFY